MPGGYSVTISATDAASRVFDGVNKRVEQMNKRLEAAQAPFKRLGDNVEKFGKVSGLTEIATGFKDIGQAGVNAFQSLARIVEPLAAITGAASLAGMYKLVSTWGEFGTQLAIAATRAGVSADSLYNLQNAAKLMGVSAETVTQSMTALNDGMRAAAIGANGPFMVALQAIGLKLSDLEKMKPEDRIAAITEALNKKTTNPSDRAAFAQMLGVDGLMPIIAQGGRAFDAARAKAKSLTGEFSPEMLARAQAFQVAQVSLTESVKGLGNSVANILGPAMVPLLDYLTQAVVFMRQWLDVNGDWLRSEISKKVGEFVTWLQGIDWAKVGTDIHDMAVSADNFAQKLGGWIPVAEGVLAFMAGSWLLGMLAPFAKLTLAVAELILKIGVGLVGSFREATVAAEGLDAVSAGSTAGLLRSGALAAAGGLLAHEGMEAVDPGDHMGAWIDKNIPGASFLDNAASHIGLGRSYEEQRRVQGTIDGTGTTQVSGGHQLSKADFVQQYGPAAEQMAAAQGISKPLALAQMALETGWGRGVIGTNNPFNIKAASGQAGHSALDKQTGTVDSYRDFPSLEAATAEYNRKLSRQWPGAQGAGNDPYKFAAGLRVGQQGGYAEATNYGDALARTMAALPASAGAPAPMPTSGAAGAAGASGKVDMNVRVTGADTTVVASASPQIGLKIVNPGLTNQ